MLQITLIFLLFYQGNHARSAPLPEDQYSAVILAYHQIGQDENPDTNLRIEQFDEHLEEIIHGNYKVLPLSQIMKSFRNGTPLPPRSLVITFEGAYRSAYDNAMLKLAAHNIPFTVIYAADRADKDSPQHINLDQLKNLKRYKGVEFGVLPYSYVRFTSTSLEEIQRQINKARMAHREIFKEEANIFSYPFGELSNAYKNIIEEAGFAAAFGLQSGVAYKGSDLYALPRFSMTENFGSIERFRLVANALPLPVKDVEPNDPYYSSPITNIGFSLPQKISEGGINCFISGQEKPDLKRIGVRVEIHPAKPIDDGRTRVNCTLPVSTDQKNNAMQWRWFGMLLINNES